MSKFFVVRRISLFIDELNSDLKSSHRRAPRGREKEIVKSWLNKQVQNTEV
jgi:hypothetical protein